MTFHAKDGLSFEKLPNGEVKVGFGPGPGFETSKVFSTILDCDTWASAIAAMSAEGDTAEGFEIARGFHLQGLKRVRYEPPTAI